MIELTYYIEDREEQDIIASARAEGTQVIAVTAGRDPKELEIDLYSTDMATQAMLNLLMAEMRPVAEANYERDPYSVPEVNLKRLQDLGWKEYTRQA